MDYLALHPQWWELTPNQRRTERQRDIRTKFKDKGANGYVEAVTGFGKTRVGEELIYDFLLKDDTRTVNIIVPHNAAKNVWLKVIDKLKAHDRVEVFMAQTYLNLDPIDRTCDFLLLDEGHRFTNELAEVFSLIIDKTKNRWCLCLSATFTLEQKKFMEKRGIKHVDTVDMKEASECGYVAKHYNWIVEEPIRGYDLIKHDDISRAYHAHWTPFNYKMNEVFACVSGGEQAKAMRAYYANKLECEEGAVYSIAKKAINIMNERKIFFRKAQSKVEIVKDIVEQFKDSNILTFGEYTDIADDLTKAMGPIARSFHSKVQGKYRTQTRSKRWKGEKARDKFFSKYQGVYSNLMKGYDEKESSPYYVSWQVKKRVGPAKIKEENQRLFEDPKSKVRVLNTSRALDEAADIDNVDVAIIWSFTGSPRQLIQRIGRVIRWAEGKIAHVFVLCMTHPEMKTQEEKWLKEALEEMNNYYKVKARQIPEIYERSQIKKKEAEEAT